jgi:hypothetical protein
MCLGQLPKRLVIGCVDSDTLNGTITKIPFDFKHYKINVVALNVVQSRVVTVWRESVVRPRLVPQH